MRTSIYLAVILFLLTLPLNYCEAQNNPAGPSFQVRFSNCVETIGVGLAPTDSVLELVPTEFIPVGIGQPVTPVVVRTAQQFNRFDDATMNVELIVAF